MGRKPPNDNIVLDVLTAKAPHCRSNISKNFSLEKLGGRETQDWSLNYKWEKVWISVLIFKHVDNSFILDWYRDFGIVLTLGWIGCVFLLRWVCVDCHYLLNRTAHLLIISKKRFIVTYGRIAFRQTWKKIFFLSVYFYNVIISEGHKWQLSPNIYFST